MDPMAAGSWLIRGGRIVDPASGRDEVADLYVHEGFLAGPPSGIPRHAGVIDASGLIVAPGLIDLHVHLREPGGTDAETIETGSLAAARGGFTTVVAMPNTHPPLDDAERILFVKTVGDAVGRVRVLPAGCLTRGRKGAQIADLEGMRRAGAVAFTDDGSTPADEHLVREALKTLRSLGAPFLDHALDAKLAGDGVMHEGTVSTALGLPGIPSAAEVSVVERDLRLAEKTGARIHIQHVSARESIARISAARSRARVTCEVTPQHLALCDEDVKAHDAVFKVNPPLRSRADGEALREAAASGLVDALATDHAPHPAAAKRSGFRTAPFGMIGLETAVPITYGILVAGKRMDLAAWLRLWTAGPARVLGLETPRLTTGRPADVVLLDLDREWVVNSSDFLSRSRNTPFEGWTVRGAAAATLCGARLTWDAGDGRVDRRESRGL